MKKLINLFRIAFFANKARRNQTENERLLAQQALVKILADSKGLAMKVGQLYADTDGKNAFQELLQEVEPLPLKKILPVLNASLGFPAKDVFKKIEEAKSAASLGQVHFAELKTGEKVAIKIRYPNITSAIETELQVAGLLPEIGPVKQWGFDLKSYKINLRNNMQRELDYLSEASRQDAFSKAVNVKGLITPDVYLDLCREGVLVQSRASGVLISKVKDWPKYDQQVIGEILLTTLFKSLFVAGDVHADPHAGNVFYDYDAAGRPVVSLLDYGCTVSVSEQKRKALLKLIVACRLKQHTNPMDCFVALGFNADKLSHIQGALPLLCQYLFEPFLIDQPMDLSCWQLENNISKLLAEKRWWFRSAGPADLLLLMRAFQGLVEQLSYLNVRLNWWDVLQKTLGEGEIKRAVDFNLPVIELKDFAATACFSEQSAKLKVQVLENEKMLVSVTLPAEAAMELDQIMPEDITTLLKASADINLEKIMTHLRLNGLSPQTLFELKNGEKEYKVWLD